VTKRQREQKKRDRQIEKEQRRALRKNAPAESNEVESEEMTRSRDENV
jgi:hypothetical protein